LQSLDLNTKAAKMQAMSSVCGDFQLPKLRSKPNTRKSRLKNQGFDIFEDAAGVVVQPASHNGQNTVKLGQGVQVHQQPVATANIQFQAISASNEANTKRRRSPPTSQLAETQKDIGRQSGNYKLPTVPLARTSRSLQVQQITVNRAGSGNGKENVPPGYLEAWQKNSSPENLCTYDGLCCKVGVSDQGLRSDTVTLVDTTSTEMIVQDVEPVGTVVIPDTFQPHQTKENCKKEAESHLKAEKERAQPTRFSFKARVTVQTSMQSLNCTYNAYTVLTAMQLIPVAALQTSHFIYSRPLVQLLQNTFQLSNFQAQSSYPVKEHIAPPSVLHSTGQSWTLSISKRGDVIWQPRLLDNCEQQTRTLPSSHTAVIGSDLPENCATFRLPSTHDASNTHQGLITSSNALQTRALHIFLAFLLLGTI